MKKSKTLEKLDTNTLTIWQVALKQLRQLSKDVWNGIRFFWIINGIIIAAIITIFKNNQEIQYGLIIFLSLIGLFFSVIATNIFIRQRKNYIDMLLRKTLIEEKLGLYDIILTNGIDLSFPWKVPKEEIKNLKKNPIEWKNKQLWRPGTISRLLMLTNIIFIILYISIIIFILLINYCDALKNFSGV